MREETDEDEAIYDDDPYVPPPIPEIIAKGLMGILGLVGLLGYIRWTVSESEQAYRVGSAAIGSMMIVMGVWIVVTTTRRVAKIGLVLWILLGIGMLSGIVTGPPGAA